MTVSIDRVSRSRLLGMLSETPDINFTGEDKKVFERCLTQTTTLYVGMVDKDFVCTWGLIPPTLMSETAYLWLYTKELKEHQFVFIRHSQVVMERMLQEYPIITGMTKVGWSKTIRWLKWLGATFSNPEGDLLPFTIRKK